MRHHTMRGIWYHFAWPRCAFCFALPCAFLHLTWLLAWLSCPPCRIWCRIIIIILIILRRRAPTSLGLPAGEVLTSHLVWTHRTTDDPRQLLGPRSSLSVRHAYTLLTRTRRTARRQAHRRFVVQALPLCRIWGVLDTVSRCLRHRHTQTAQVMVFV
jgi:hypothetical protein